MYGRFSSFKRWSWRQSWFPERDQIILAWNWQSCGDVGITCMSCCRYYSISREPIRVCLWWWNGTTCYKPYWEISPDIPGVCVSTTKLRNTYLTGTTYATLPMNLFQQLDTIMLSMHTNKQANVVDESVSALISAGTNQIFAQLIKNS